MQEIPSSGIPQEPVSIFDDVEDLRKEEHGKTIRKARHILFFVGGLMFIVDMVVCLIQHYEGRVFLTILALDLLVLAAFIGLGLWTRKKPFSAILCGLILFGIIQVVNGISDPRSLGQGIFLKISIIAALVSGLKGARALQEIMTREEQLHR